MVAALVAVGGASLGAWLGFHVPSTPALGAITALFGATAASNLALISLDLGVRAHHETGGL